MSKTEDAILNRLSANPGEIVSAIELEGWVYGTDDPPSSNVIQVSISRLRKRGHTIKNKKGQGYRLLQDES